MFFRTIFRININRDSGLLFTSWRRLFFNVDKNYRFILLNITRNTQNLSFNCILIWSLEYTLAFRNLNINQPWTQINFPISSLWRWIQWLNNISPELLWCQTSLKCLWHSTWSALLFQALLLLNIQKLRNTFFSNIRTSFV